MEIHLWSSGRAPENSYTVEFKLLDSDDQVISFGAANPVRATYYLADHQHFVCRLGPLPLTEGSYTFSFTVRVWNKDAVGLLAEGDWFRPSPAAICSARVTASRTSTTAIS